jgi:DNA (cytosine-5)-methyltransferase 1
LSAKKHFGFRAVDLFCGAGGLSLGLQRAGFEVAAAVDNDAWATATYRRNLGDHVLQRSLTELTPKVLMRTAGLQQGDCDLLAGGPPCQGFSVQRRGDDKDSRNALVLTYLRFVTELMPRFFLMENVEGLASRRGREFLDTLIQKTSRLGYHVQTAKLNAVDYGIAQERTRLFVIGERTTGTPLFNFPERTHRFGTYRTVRDAIGDLPRPPIDGSPHPTVPNHFQEGRLSATNLARIRCVPEGGGRDDLPRRLQLACHRDNPTHRHKDVYGRLAWDLPSGTITARFDSFTRGRFGHPEQDRSITCREGARLQTFPDDFIFLGNREEVARQIGNAVPPVLAETVGKQIVAALNMLRRRRVRSPHRSASQLAAHVR